MTGNGDCPYCHRPDFLPITGTNPPAGICPNCGLYRLRIRSVEDPTEPRPQNVSIQTKFPDPPLTAAHPFEIAFIHQYCPELFRGGKALDIGCGLGGFVAAL